MLQIRVLAGPGDSEAGRQFDLRVDRRPGRFDVAAQVPACDVEIDVAGQASVLALDFGRPVGDAQAGDCPERHLDSGRGGNPAFGKRLHRVTQGARIAQVDGKPFAPVHDRIDVLTADGALDQALNRRDGYPVARAACARSISISRYRPPATRSPNTARVPGIFFSVVSSVSASAAIPARSGPVILMPTAVRMPVDNMSMRVRIGLPQELVRPGNRTARSSFWISSSTVSPGGHSFLGLSRMVVSSMDSGAGSVALSARPALPNTRATSGIWRISRSVICRILAASSTDTPGNVVGMYSRSPSYSGGMNSLPRRETGHAALASSRTASSSTRLG